MQTESDKPHCISNLLQDSEVLLRSMIENLPGGAAFVVDSDLRYRLAEGEALSAAGFQPEDLVGRTIFEVLPSELAASYEPQYRKALAGEPFEVEHQAHNRFYISRGTPLRSANGEVYGVLAVSYDITERKQADRALRESETKYQSLFNAMDEGYMLSEVIFDKNDKPIDILYLEANPAAIRLAGRDFSGKRMREIDPNYEEYWYEIYGRIALTGEAVRAERYAEPHGRWFEFYAFKVGEPESRRVATVFQDITDRKRVENECKRQEEALRESEERLRDVLNSMSEGFALLGGDFTILDVNEETLRLDGRSRDELIGRSHWEVFPGTENSTVGEIFKRVVRERTSASLEHAYHWPDGRSLWLDMRAYPTQNDGVVIFWRDVTDRKQAEAALRESEAKYRSLFNSMDEAYAVVEVMTDENGEWNDFLFLEVNPAFVKQTGMEYPVGRKATELLGTPNPQWAKVYGRVAETGEPIRFEEGEATLGRVFDLYVFRLGGEGSRRVAVLFADITDRKRAEETLRENEARQAFLLKLSDILQRFVKPNDIKAAAMRLLGEHFGVSRAQYHECDSSGEYYSADGIGYANGLPLLDLKYRIDTFGTFVNEDFAAGRPYRIDDLEVSPRVSAAEREAYRTYGIRAGAGVPLIRGGKLVAILAVHDVHPHPWTDLEIDLIRETAERIWTPLERARAEEALRESEAKYRSLFDSIDTGFCIFEMLYNEASEAIDFRYIETNPAFERQSGRRPQPGQTMRELFPEAEDMWLKDYAEVARTGQAKRFIDHHKDLDRWFDVFVFPTSNGKNQLAALFSDVTEEKRAEAALRESEERLQKAISIETVGVLFFTLDGRITDANDTFLRMSGYSRDEARNIANWQDLTPPEFLDVTNCAAEELATLGKTAPYEKQHLRKDGSRWWGLFSPTRLKGSGRNAECVEFVIDINDRKHAEAQLRRAADMDAFRVKLSDALRSLTDPVQIQAEACRLLGEQLGVDRAYYVEVHEAEGYARVNQHYSRGDSPSIVGEYPLAEYGWSLPIMRRGETIVITDTQSSNLVPDHERAAMAMLQMVGFVALPLIKGEVLVGALTLNEPTPREWTEAEVELVRETAERIWADIQRARAEAALRESELQRVREQSEREQERQRAESLAELDRAKTQFFSNVSHEFRTPLTLSLAPLQDALSDRTHPLDPIHRERLELVHRNNLRLLKLVNTLLDFSRIEAGRMEAVYEPTDLATYTAELSSVFRSAIERAGLQLIVDCPPLPEPVFVDREMWEKIVLNLLSNAFKFTFEGEITVSLRSTNSNQAVLQIQDTGTGIAPEHLPHLFERFYQVRSTQARTHEGSGIGLALVHELVQLHGGTIDVRSTVGQGTCFAIALPFGTEHLPNVRVASPQENRLHLEGDRNQPTRTLTSTAMGATAYVAEAERWLPKIPPQPPLERGDNLVTVPLNKGDLGGSPESKTDSASSARVLLIDDNADMREYLTHILSEYVQIEAVADGATALAIAQERVPDLILSDVMMPGLDGFELLEALRADSRTKEIPIILLSARAGEDAIVEGLQAGADDYLIKPFSAQELVSRVTTHLQMSHIRGEALQKARSTIRNRDEFISVVSHELNTPLVSILGWTRILQSNPPSPAMLIKALDIIEYNAMLQAKLVQDLLDISRISAGKLRLNLEPVELEGVIEKAIATVHNLAQAKQINLMWYGDTSKVKNVALVVMGDRERLSQVVCNLLTNAIKFTPKLGSVTVELSAIEDNNFPEDSCTQITVRDTGIGIAADFLPHVFDRFRQARESDAAKGLGLGLAIARHIVELHQGTIHAESAGVGVGATFIVRLPLYKPNDRILNPP